MGDVDVFRILFEKAGWWGIAAGAAMVGIRWLRKPVVQGSLPVWAQWSMWPRPLRLLVVLVSALGAAVVASLTAGMGLVPALIAALPTAAAAVLGHKTTKDLGHTIQAAAQAGKVTYRPGSIRTALDVVGALPLDHKRLTRKRPYA